MARCLNQLALPAVNGADKWIRTTHVNNRRTTICLACCLVVPPPSLTRFRPSSPRQKLKRGRALGNLTPEATLFPPPQLEHPTAKESLAPLRGAVNSFFEDRDNFHVPVLDQG